MLARHFYFNNLSQLAVSKLYVAVLREFKECQEMRERVKGVKGVKGETENREYEGGKENEGELFSNSLLSPPFLPNTPF